VPIARFNVHAPGKFIFPIESTRPHRIAENARPSRALNRHMRTESQDHASRENGAKSHGATTPEGKLASARNALKHGMLSDTIVLECESQDRFLQLVVSLHEEFQPQTPFEESLIENMAVARWRLMRVRGMETAGMDYEMRRQAEMSEDIPEDNATRASLAFRTLCDDSRSLELINRYEARYDRQYYRAYRCFIETRDRRTPPSAQPSSNPVAAPLPEPCPPQSEPEKVILPDEPKLAVSEPEASETELTARPTGSLWPSSPVDPVRSGNGEQNGDILIDADLDEAQGEE
jgi:hypothetical protein